MATVIRGALPASTIILAALPEWLAQWSVFARDLLFEDLLDKVLDRAELVIFDRPSAIMAAPADPEVNVACHRLLATASGGLQAILPNGMRNRTAGTTLQVDEGYRNARGHSSDHVVPAVPGRTRCGRTTGRDAVAAAGGVDAALARAGAYKAADADVPFVEAPGSHESLRTIAHEIEDRSPLMANMVERWQTPIQKATELDVLGFSIEFHRVNRIVGIRESIALDKSYEASK